MKTRTGLIAAAFLAAVSTVAIAAGNYLTYSIVGSPSFCASNNPNSPSVGGTTGQGGVANCVQTVPAGPTVLTGEELIPADTGAAGPTQTVTIPSSLLGNATNRLIGGDMTTNLTQRLNTTKGVTALATLSPTAAVITADRWWVIAPAAGVTVTIDSTAATAVIPGLNNTKALRVARTSSGAAGNMCVGQTLDKEASAPLIGNNAVFSFYESNGAGMSAANGAITVNVDYTSASNTSGTQSTLGFAGGNGSLFALGDVGLLSAGPTNMTRAIAGVSPGTTGTVAAGVATIPASTTWNRYAVYAPIPVNVPGTTTPVTSVSVSICWAPVLTSAISTDWIEINGMQLEAKPSTATPSLLAGVISPSAFSRRPAADEQLYQYYYWYFNYESQTLVSNVPGTSCTTTTSTTAGMCTLTFPVAMRIVPTVKFTDGFQLFTSTAYTTLGAASNLAVYTNTLTTVANNTGIMFIADASTLPAVGTQNFLMTLGTSSATGIISASAEP